MAIREDAEQKQRQEECEKESIRFRAVYVFDMADTDGKPIPQFGNAEGDPSDRTVRLKEFLSSRRIQLEYSDAIYPAQGQCSPGKIVILPGQSAPEEFATLVHEVAHALLHQGEQRTETSKRVRETEAEAVAFVVCEGIGLAAISSVDYIHLYDGNKETLTASYTQKGGTVSPVGPSGHGSHCKSQIAGSGGRVRGTSGERRGTVARLLKRSLRTKLNFGHSCF